MNKETMSDFVLAEYAKTRKGARRRAVLRSLWTSSIKVPKEILRKIGILEPIKRAWYAVRPLREFDFGEETMPYQSFPMLGIKGQRPTDLRLSVYGMMDILTKDMDVLDIGSNIGFFDMTLAPHVKSVLGVEYNQEYVAIANAAAKKLDIANVAFVSGDFAEWSKENKETFDVVLSFAVHHWIGLPSEKYASMLHALSAPGGYLFLESHDISVPSEGEYFDSLIDMLFRRGFEKSNEGEIMDDGTNLRRWIVLHLTAKNNEKA